MRVAAAVAGILLVALLAWIGGEAHYQGCVASAVAVTEDVRAVPSVVDQLGGKVAPKNGARIGAVDVCSRLPF